MIFINDISFRYGDTEILPYDLPSNFIIQRIILLYLKKVLDIWNSNSNIDVGNFDHIFVK